jgi:hypothetical protein
MVHAVVVAYTTKVYSVAEAVKIIVVVAAGLEEVEHWD